MKAAPALLLALACLVTGAPRNQQESLTIFDYDADIFEEPLNKQDFGEEAPGVIPKKGKGVLSLPQRDEAVTDLPSTNDADLPTCLLCVCLSGSVYCEETDIESIPPLPKETAYLYARFNKIKKISVKDFADIPTLKRIDLTGNVIDEIEDGAFAKLNLLDQLSLADNKLTRLPTLPANLTSFNANNNKIKSKAIKANAFKKMNNLSYLYLAQNALESVPANLPESLRIVHLQFNNITSITDDTFCKSDNTRYIRTKLDEVRMEGNPVILGKYPNSFTCLKMLPIGSYF